MKTVFITGTDTDAGKTYVSSLLLKAVNQKGLRSVGFKPIAAGCEQTADGLRNEDALALQSAASVKLPYDLINPISFEPPIAPHIAAAQLQQEIDMGLVLASLNKLQNENADLLLVEGAGGWRLPVIMPTLLSVSRSSLNANKVHNSEVVYLSDFVSERQLPVVLVVGMKLGCLNHAALTLEQIKRDNCVVIGWIANQVDPNMDCYALNLASLHALLDAPFLGEVGYNQQKIEFADNALDLILQQSQLEDGAC
jgi:dethiobiotin synthetase